jgi:hypothetical protein
MARRRFPRPRQTCPPGTRIASVRQLHQTTAFGSPRKDAQGKDEIDAAPTEYSKSGTDSDVAHSDTAFDPDTTKPETEKKRADPKARNHFMCD